MRRFVFGWLLLVLSVGSASAASGPVAPPAAPSVQAAIAGSDVTLSWQAQPGSRFYVWRCAEGLPQFVKSTPGTMYRVAGGVPAAGQMTMWFVEARRGGAFAERSNLVGVFSFGLVPGS